MSDPVLINSIVRLENGDIEIQLSETQGNAYTRHAPGVIVELKPEYTLLRKVFRAKAPEIYLPGQLDEAWFAAFGSKRSVMPPKHNTADFVVLAGTGVSDFNSEDVEKYWGSGCKNYVPAATNLLVAMLGFAGATFPGLKQGIIHGSSPKGIDLALQKAAKHMKVPQLGFSCPSFLFFVEDAANDIPIYVAPDQEAYARTFAESGTVLAGINGRKQAYALDRMHFLGDIKSPLLLPLLQTLCPDARVPAMLSDGRIYDAVELAMQVERQLSIPRFVGPTAWTSFLAYSVQLYVDSISAYLKPELRAALDTVYMPTF